MQDSFKPGIYFNAAENKVVRVNSPYWIPEVSDWVFLTGEVNSTLLQVRDLIGKDDSLVSDGLVVWSSIPLKD